MVSHIFPMDSKAFTAHRRDVLGPLMLLYEFILSDHRDTRKGEEVFSKQMVEISCPFPMHLEGL
jgi:hypothetical protein